MSLKLKCNKTNKTNPPRLLDPILTTLSNFYQTPEIISPLDNDPNKDGKPSDHSIVIAEPISEINNTCARQLRTIKVRPMQEHKLNILKSYFKCEQWQSIIESTSAHEQAHLFHSQLVKKCDQIIPEKKKIISSDDQPWYTERLKKLNKKKKQEYHKKRKSVR